MFFRRHARSRRDTARTAAYTMFCAVLVAHVVRAQAVHDTAGAGVTFAAPLWAFPVQKEPPAGSLAAADTAATMHLRTAHTAFTVARTRDRYDVADWNPETHGAAPAIVMHGRKPAVMACGFCHLADGRGRPENAMLSGLPADYLIQQVKDMRTRARQTASPVPYAPGIAMQQIADSVTDEELADAARYFAGVRARRASRVIEGDRVPHATPLNGLSARGDGHVLDSLGARIIEMPDELRLHELHDPMAAYAAYVPRGSIARGRKLAAGNAARGMKGCTSCHGPALRGVGLVPPIAGRSPSYLMRQLVAFRTGARSSAAGAPMREVAAKLSEEDMIAAAAYAGSRTP